MTENKLMPIKCVKGIRASNFAPAAATEKTEDHSGSIGRLDQRDYPYPFSPMVFDSASACWKVDAVERSCDLSAEIKKT